MTDPYYDQVRALILKNGAMGVNALQKEIGIPLSTMQRYLEKQTYFKKTDQRKWDLPENVVKTQTSEVITNYDAVIESQITGIYAMFEMLTSQMKSTITLIGAQKTVTPPVADKSVNLPERLVKLHEATQAMPKAIKQHINNIPEEYRDILLKVKWLDLALDTGLNYYNDVIGNAIMGLMATDQDNIDDEVLTVLEKYQS